MLLGELPTLDKFATSIHLSDGFSTLLIDTPPTNSSNVLDHLKTEHLFARRECPRRRLWFLPSNRDYCPKMKLEALGVMQSRRSLWGSSDMINCSPRRVAARLVVACRLQASGAG